MRRREFLGALSSAAAVPLIAQRTARAQHLANPVIGYLSARSPDAETSLRVLFLETLEKLRLHGRA